MNMVLDNAPMEMSFGMPRAPHIVVHAHLTRLQTSCMLHLTTSESGSPNPSTAAMGSFVYAMPDRFNERNTICTELFATEATVEFATRLAKILARRTMKPVYVGCSMSMRDITTEEEMEVLKNIVDTTLSQFSLTA